MNTIDRAKAPEPAVLQPFVFPQVRRTSLDNGVKVLSAKHGRLPIVTVQVVVDAGAALEDPKHGGLAYLTAAALDAGTATRTADELAWAFEHLGGELTAQATWDGVLIQVTAPTSRLEAALELVADVVRNPRFPEDQVDRLRDEQLADIQHRFKEPRALATDMAAHFIFGPDALYGRPLIGTAEPVRGLKKEHVDTFHRSHFAPAATSVMLVGDVADVDARELVQRYFGDWPGARPRTQPESSPPAASATTIFLVDRPDAAQSEIRVGHVGLPRIHEDYFALLVMNTILGGAFTSRLNLSLRERHGFTYGVRSGFAFRRAPGPFMIHTAVATEVTARAVEEILREVRLMHEAGATAEEVDAGRRYLAGVLPLELQTTEQLAGRLAELVIYDLPDDYFAHYPSHIAAVTVDDVSRVAAQQLRPGQLVIVVVGRSDALAEDLAGLGPVERHTASIAP